MSLFDSSSQFLRLLSFANICKYLLRTITQLLCMSKKLDSLTVFETGYKKEIIIDLSYQYVERSRTELQLQPLTTQQKQPVMSNHEQ